MAGILDRLMGRVKSQQVERLSTGWEGYRQLLAETVEDENAVDASEVEIVLGTLGRTAEQFADDVSTYKRRLAWASQVRQGESAQLEAVKCETRIHELRAELGAHHIRLSAEIDATQAAMTAAMARTRTAGYAEHHLRTTCLDVGLLQREADLRERRKTVLDDAGELQEIDRELAALVAAKLTP